MLADIQAMVDAGLITPGFRLWLDGLAEPQRQLHVQSLVETMMVLWWDAQDFTEE